MSTIKSTPDLTRKPYAILMRGRPEEGASWDNIAVYSREELAEFRAAGWKPSREFMEQVDRARTGRYDANETYAVKEG